MPKLSTLTLPIQNPIPVLEYVAEGKLEEIVFNVRHKRLTSSVINEVGHIADELYKENRKNYEARQKAEKDNKPQALKETKNAIAAQLAYLVEYTDIFDDAGEVLPPTVETFLKSSINAQTKLLEGIMKTTVPSKKSFGTSSDGTEQGDTLEPRPVG